jgi:hypothetical protein
MMLFNEFVKIIIQKLFDIMRITIKENIPGNDYFLVFFLYTL